MQYIVVVVVCYSLRTFGPEPSAPRSCFPLTVEICGSHNVQVVLTCKVLAVEVMSHVWCKNCPPTKLPEQHKYHAVYTRSRFWPFVKHELLTCKYFVYM